MRNCLAIATPLVAVTLLWGSCNDNNFSGSGSGGAKTETDDGTTPKADAEQPSACVSGDKVNIQWTGPVKECLDQGKTYNYEEQKCAAMRQSQFDCNWDTVKDELEKRNLLTEVLRTDAENGSKLVSCGQASDGNRIVVQWIKVDDAKNIDCSDGSSSHHITTGCYTLFASAEDRPPEASSAAERSKQVYACMNEL